MSSAPLDDEEFRRWRVEADAALRGAGLHADAGLHNWACFGAEQAAQLAVKGMLHGLGRGPWGHDLVYLAEQLAQVVEIPEDVLDACRRLSRHYIPARYPDAHPSGPPSAHYSATDSGQALADSTLIFSFVDGQWDTFSA